MKKRSIIIFITLMAVVLLHKYNPTLFDFNWIHNLYGPNIFLREQQALPRIIGLTMLGLTLLFGPFFCGWICPFGTFQKMIHYLSKPFKRQYKVPTKLDAILKYIKYFHLLIVVFILLNDKMIHYISIDPYHALFKLLIGGLTLYGGLTLITVILLSFFFERPYCQWFCPYGAGLNLISSFRALPIQRTNSCINCHKCDNNCPMGITLTSTDTIKDINCISCDQCFKVCPVKPALKRKVKWHLVFLNILLMVLFVVFTQPKPLPVIEPVTTPLIPLQPAIVRVETPIHHVFFDASFEFIAIKDLSSKNLEALKAHQEALEKQRTIEAEKQAKLEAERQAQLAAEKEALENDRSEGEYYYDGTYKAKVNGYQPDMIVQVTIKNDKITLIEVLEHDETRSYFNFAAPKIIDRILTQNTPEVKIVAGATYTSRGIKNGVRNCLNQALK